MTPALGFWCVFGRPLIDSDRVAKVSALLTDSRWPWKPQLVRPMPAPGVGTYAWPKGKVADLRGTIEAVLHSEAATAIHLTVSKKDEDNGAFVVVDNGSPHAVRESDAYPFRAVGLSRYPVPEGKSVDAWHELVRELVLLLGAGHGVIWADDERFVVARQFVSGAAQARSAVDHPGNEAHRINRAREHLGDRYVRFPGWATFLHRTHVTAIGGREKLLAIVQPPVVRDVGELLYVQLSASVEEANAPQAEARRQAFIELLAPILVPMPAAR
jgi:hypothetical protein